MNNDNILEQTNFIDCNRLLSEEVIGGNKTETSSFTNKLTTPLTVNVGDKISLHSAFINQRGAGSDIIEFTGREQKQKVKLINTSFTFQEYQQNLPPYDHKLVSVRNVETETVLKDTEAYITFNYYKTSNGEGYYMLPRKFLTEYFDFSTAQEISDFQNNWNYDDSNAMGLCYTSVSDSDRHAECDYYEDVSLTPAGLDFLSMKPKNDNSRFTIFTMMEVQFGVRSTPIDLTPHNPAWFPYTRYKETKVLSVDQGFDTPSNIASSLTNQLKNTIKNDYGNFSITNSGVKMNSKLYPDLETETYKLFTCANELSFSKTHYDNFFFDVMTPTPPGVFDEEKAVDYKNSYMNIGVKRPELFELGRELKSIYHSPYQSPFLHPWSLKIEIDISASDSPLLVTDQSFESIGAINYQMEQLLIDLSNLFKAQEKYPELFDYSFDSKVQADNTRFLHINSSEALGSYLGNDNYQLESSASEVNKISFPLFIKYDKTQENNGSNLGQDLENFSDLIYGFGIKYLHTDGYHYLAFKINQTLRPKMFNASGKIPANTTKLGWDWNFSAYGNVCMNLFTGYLIAEPEKIQENAQYVDEYLLTPTTKLRTSAQIRQCYLGCYDPLIKFNNVQERFSISRLHTPEFQSNFFNSGLNDSNGDIGVPIIDGGTEVYKINKYLNQFTFCPNMKPYQIALEDYDHNEYRLINKNIIKNIIYDSQCGLFIETTNVSEENWSKNLLNILGFSYNQFNTNNLNINRQTRFTNNLVNANVFTTNGLVDSTNIIDFVRSIFGAKYFTNQVPLSGIPHHAPQIASYSLNPNIQEQCNSTEIFAKNLPKKMHSSHYVIRSDILDQLNYSNSISKYPIIGICPLSNEFGDYYVSEDNQIDFTVTKSRTITDIHTEIVNPAGELINCDRNSSVIYKITKFIDLNLNLNKK